MKRDLDLQTKILQRLKDASPGEEIRSLEGYSHAEFCYNARQLHRAGLIDIMDFGDLADSLDCMATDLTPAGRRAGAALHRAQGAQPARSCAQAPARRGQGRLMHAKTAAEVLARRKAFLAKWKLRCRPVATSLEEAGARLFTFVCYPPEQWRSARDDECH